MKNKDISIYFSGIWANPWEIPHDDWIDKAIDITRFGLEIFRVPNVQVFSNLKDLLDFAIGKNYDFAVVQSAGSYIYGDFYPETVNWLQKQGAESWLIAGHILDQPPAWYWLHPQFFIINLKIYQELNMPDFGFQNLGSVDIVLPNCLRSAENMHDDYTPAWLQPNDQKIKRNVELKLGWNMIKTSLENGYKVVNVPPCMRQYKRNTYIEDPRFGKMIDVLLSDQIKKNRLDPETQFALEGDQWRFVQYVNREANMYKHGLYLRNNEDAMSLLDFRCDTIDHIISVAAGFAPNAMLIKNGFHNETMITWCDVSQHALDFKKYIADNWDGRDLYGAWINFKSNAQLPSKLYGNSDDPSYLSIESYCQEAAIDHEDWLKHWPRFKSLQADYCLLDIVQEQEKLIAIIKASQSKRILVWLSNCLLTHGTLIELIWKKQISIQDWMVGFLNECQEISVADGKIITILDYGYGQLTFGTSITA